MTTIRPLKWLFAVLALLLGGLTRLPIEQAFTRELQAKDLSEERLNLGLRDELGQSFFIAVLGGFRSLVASLIEVESLDAWQQENWAKVDAAYALCTRLQPREYHYWDFRAYMSAYNAFEYYKYQDMSRPGLKPWIRQNLVDHAIGVLKDGIKHIPDNYHLPESIAILTSNFEKNQNANYYEASQWYHQAWQLRPTRRFLWRNYVYNLSRAEGHELEAWPLLLEAYHSGLRTDALCDHTPTVRTLLSLLYDKVKAAAPETTLPAELAVERLSILAKEKARVERDAKRRAGEEKELKAAEDLYLQKHR